MVPLVKTCYYLQNIVSFRSCSATRSCLIPTQENADKAHKICIKIGSCLSYFVSEKKVVPITVLLAFLLYIAIALVFYLQ